MSDLKEVSIMLKDGRIIRKEEIEMWDISFCSDKKCKNKQCNY